MKEKPLKPVILKIPPALIPKEGRIMAYLFNADGKLIESVPFTKGEAQFKSGRKILKSKVRLFIVPELPPEIARKKIDENFLIKIGAYQPTIKLSPENTISLTAIPEFVKFFFKRCLIDGSVTKNFQIDGEDKVLPVCHARVHICEVDPLYFLIPRVIDRDILDIRDRLIEMIVEERFPEPPNPPDPIGPVSRLLRLPQDKFMKRKLAEFKTLALPVVSDEIISGLSSHSLKMVRETLVDHIGLLRPYLCWYPHRWPFLYRCDEIAVVYTDCNGRFEYPYWYLAGGDQPDIYIWVEVNINGVWETVYRPSKACATHWNYKCGKDINIRLTDERVRPCECDPMPGEVVWMKRVNDGISIRNIQQFNLPSGHLANSIGLTTYSAGLNVSPFGNAFPFVVQFGSGLPSGSVTHYRWKYRQLRDASLNAVAGSPVEYDGIVNKAYTYERVNSEGDTVFYTGSFQLGPVFTSNGPMYKIPHDEASVDVPTEPTAEWNQDTYSIHVNSLNLNNGLYEFTFELLNNAGNVVALDPDIFVVDKKTGEVSNPPDAPTISADDVPEPYVLKNILGKAVGFRFVIRIDNQVCFADIKDALVDGVGTHTECGFAQYANKLTSQVTLRFEASHPQDFAHYGFHVVKGNGNSAGNTDTAAYVTLTNNLYSRIGDLYFKNLPVIEMLGTCDKAAFAENLGVYATHTNGNRRLDEYDRYDTAAFAIEPETP